MTTLQKLWAITSYFNPVHYKRRLANYRMFRAALEVPLVTVELSGDGSFELDRRDADVLVQVRGEPFLWQKERLLNVALRHVPESVSLIAWTDCDVVFERSDWPAEAEQLLDSDLMVQLFSHLCDLPKDVSVADVARHPDSTQNVSIARLVELHQIAYEAFGPSANGRRTLFGLGWAARRNLLESHGFYDAMILGGGDRMMVCAAYGRFADAEDATRLDARRSLHYRRWAEPFFDDVRGRVGYVDGRVFHLWHGDLRNRQYAERHVQLASLDFDPFSDITMTDEGCWAWTGNEQVETFVRHYFELRKEDGDSEREPCLTPSRGYGHDESLRRFPRRLFGASECARAARTLAGFRGNT